MLDFDDLDTYLTLFDVAEPFGVDPSASIESEQFFRVLLEEYQGSNDPDDIRAWLAKKIQDSFVAVGERPMWLQSAQWPVVSGRPMVFVGQVDLDYETATRSGLLHDSTSFYIFVGLNTPPKVVVQQT